MLLRLPHPRSKVPLLGNVEFAEQNHHHTLLQWSKELGGIYFIRVLWMKVLPLTSNPSKILSAVAPSRAGIQAPDCRVQAVSHRSVNQRGLLREARQGTENLENSSPPEQYLHRVFHVALYSDALQCRPL